MFPRRFGNREAPSFRKLKLSSVDRAPLGALLAWRGARQGAPSGGATVTSNTVVIFYIAQLGDV